MKFLNFNFVAEKINRSIAGSIGLILTVPLTAIIAEYLEKKN
ncbi:YibE/F family protein [Candidatus Parcubacteria bacterium]|nr:YibE/F family protein [Candidatus Parcubacteria bacterium]